MRNMQLHIDGLNNTINHLYHRTYNHRCSVVYVLTGSTIWEAGTVALVEPMLNGLWFYLLHRLWKRFA